MARMRRSPRPGRGLSRQRGGRGVERVGRVLFLLYGLRPGARFSAVSPRLLPEVKRTPSPLLPRRSGRRRVARWAGKEPRGKPQRGGGREWGRPGLDFGAACGGRLWETGPRRCPGLLTRARVLGTRGPGHEARIPGWSTPPVPSRGHHVGMAGRRVSPASPRGSGSEPATPGPPGARGREHRLPDTVEERGGLRDAHPSGAPAAASGRASGIDQDPDRLNFGSDGPGSSCPTAKRLLPLENRVTDAHKRESETPKVALGLS